VSTSTGSQPPSEPPAARAPAAALEASAAQEQTQQASEAAGGTHAQPARPGSVKPPLILKGLGRLARNTLASAWVSWLMALADGRGGAPSVVAAATQRALGRKLQQGEALVTYDAAMAEQTLEAFRKRACDLTVELVVTTFAR
jgi:hypothetical protein